MTTILNSLIEETEDAMEVAMKEEEASKEEVSAVALEDQEEVVLLALTLLPSATTVATQVISSRTALIPTLETKVKEVTPVEEEADSVVETITSIVAHQGMAA